MHDCAHAYGTSQWDFDCGKLHILQNSTFERWRECPPLWEWCAIRRQRCPNEKRIWHQQLNGVSTFLALSVMSLFASSFQRGRRDRNIKNDRQASRYTDRQGLVSGVWPGWDQSQDRRACPSLCHWCSYQCYSFEMRMQTLHLNHWANSAWWMNGAVVKCSHRNGSKIGLLEIVIPSLSNTTYHIFTYSW